MGGSSSTTTGYTYQAAIMIGLCAGPVQGIGTVWNDKTRITLADLNLSASLGAPGQAAWGHLTTHHPDQAVPYSGLAHVDCPLFSLDSNAGIQNLSFEVMGKGQLEGHNDAQPDYILNDFLSQAGFPAANIGDFEASGYAAYCRAAGLFLSPALTEQAEASAFLKQIAQCTNSEFIWSQGKLTIIPYADAAITGNGVTFTPNITPIYDLTDDDFIVSDASEAPVNVSRITTADAYNHVQVEYVDRAQDYNVAIAEAKDQADIEAKGLRTQDPVKLHYICDAAVARAVAQLLLQRVLYIRNTYTFKLSWKYCLLEPLDLVTLTDTTLGLNLTPVKITQIDEDENGLLTVTAEEYPFGVNSHTIYPHQNPLGYLPNYQVAPGDANAPVIFECPYQLAPTGLEVWLATSGGTNWGGCEVWVSEDNVSYTLAGTLNGKSRHGFLSSALPSGSATDTTNTLAVDLTTSSGQLLSGTQQDAQSLNTLCYVDGELLAYETATLTASNTYNLTYLIRGAYGSTISAHASGSRFARLDGSIFTYPFRQDQIGKTIYIKLVSFNVYGGAQQDISTLSAHTYTITGAAVVAMPPADVAMFQVSANKSFVDLSWNANTDYDIAGYEIRLGSSWASGTVLVSNHKSSKFSWQPTQTGNLQFWLKALDSSGNYSVNAVTAILTINAATISNLSQQVIDNNVLLTWQNNQGTFAIDHVEIRRGLTFATAQVVGSLSGTFTTIFETASGTYKYWIAPKDISGLYGTEMGIYAVVNQPPDFVLQDQRSLALTGTFTSCIPENGNLLAPVNTTETFQGHFTAHSWTTPQNQIDAGYPVYTQPASATGRYVEIVDYGATIPNTRVSLALTKTAIVGDVTITPTLSTSLDGTTWTDYAGVYEVYAVNFRYVKIALAFATSNAGIVSITTSTLRLDVKLKTVQGMATVAATDSGGTVVDITGQFLDVHSINLTPQGTTSATALYDFVDAANPTQFKILLFNTSGTRINGTVSWTLRGV